MLDTIGIGKVADLSCIYMEDLLEEGIVITGGTFLPRLPHDVFKQREPMTTGNPVWVEGVRANELVHPSVGTTSYRS